MTIFVGPPNTDATPPSPPTGDVVEAGGWWPDVTLAEIRAYGRIDTTVTADRLRPSIANAILEIVGELTTWQGGKILAGFESLADVPARLEVNGESDYVIRWRRAVASVVAADMQERNLGSQLSSAGAERAEQLSADIDVHQRNVRHAVRDFLGLPRIRARMI